MHTEHNLNQECIEAFHSLWDKFPGPVTLVHKSKRVIAANPACAAIGREVGMLCSQHGPAESHKGCLAHLALSTQQCQCVRKQLGEKDLIIYWLPLSTHPDYYIHFAIPVPETAAPFA